MSKALRLFLVDDELPALSRLRDVLSDCISQCAHEIVGTATNGVTALSRLAELEVDAVILDIQMPQMSGIEVARKLQLLAHPPLVVFATAFEDYGVAAFDVRAVDYLLKPIRQERLLMALRRVEEARGNVEQRNVSPSNNLDSDSRPMRSHFSVTERGRVHLIPVGETCYLKAEQKYITLRTPDREYLLEDSLTRIEEEFGNRFVRIHRNCLVACDAIASFEREVLSGGEAHWVAVLRNVPERLAVSRRQQHVIRDFGKPKF